MIGAGSPWEILLAIFMSSTGTLIVRTAIGMGVKRYKGVEAQRSAEVNHIARQLEVAKAAQTVAEGRARDAEAKADTMARRAQYAEENVSLLRRTLFDAGIMPPAFPLENTFETWRGDE